MSCKIDPLKHKMRVGDEHRSGGGETSWRALNSNRPGIGNRDGAVFVQFALPAVIEQPEGRVAALLNLGQHDAGADGVDRAGRNEDDVALAAGRHCVRRQSNRP